MSKKYPKDTHVTLDMLQEILPQHLYPKLYEKIEEMIEPPKPEPKDGEWWLVECSNGWLRVMRYQMPYFWKEYNPERDDNAGAMSLNSCKPIRKVNIENSTTSEI